MPQLFDTLSYAWNPDAIYHGTVGILIIIMGLFTVYRERGTRVGRLYLWYTLALGTWVMSLALLLMTTSNIIADFWIRLGNASIVFIPAIFFHISTILLNLTWVKRRYIVLFWFFSLVFAFFALFSEGYIVSIHHFDWGYFGIFGPVGIAFILYFATLVGFTIYLYIPICRNASSGSVMKKRATLLLLSFIIGLGGVIDFIPSFSIDLHPNGFIFIFILFSISTYVTWRFRLVDITAEYAADNILNLINSPLMVFDLEGEIRLTNEAAERLLRLTNKENLATSLFTIIRQAYIQEMQRGLVHTEEDTEFKYTIRSHRQVFSLSISPLMSRQNTLIAYVCLLRDITERTQTEELQKRTRDELESHVKERTKQLQAEIAQHKQTAEALLTAKNYAEAASQAKTEFLSRISHELRTPLNALLGFTQLLNMDQEQIPNPDHRLYIAQMSKAGEHLLALIEDILDLSRIEMGKLSMSIETIDLSPIVSEAIRIVKHMAETRDVRIFNKIEAKHHCIVRGDSTRVKQIIINIFSNAVKYNRVGGSITVECGKHNGNYRISIIDTGIGIAEQDRERVFEPFEKLDNWRHHTDGAGIGLALSRRLAYEMNGDLSFTSEEKVGSTFWLELPAA